LFASWRGGTHSVTPACSFPRGSVLYVQTTSSDRCPFFGPFPVPLYHERHSRLDIGRCDRSWNGCLPSLPCDPGASPRSFSVVAPSRLLGRACQTAPLRASGRLFSDMTRRWQLRLCLPVRSTLPTSLSTERVREHRYRAAAPIGKACGSSRTNRAKSMALSAS